MADVFLSVVIPCYNCSQTIEACVASVIAECEVNKIVYEILLIDDGSSDNTLSLCNGLKNKNPNIRVFTQKNSGPSVARNRGIKEARGEFVAFNDSDDLWIAGKLSVQLDFFTKNEDVALVCSCYGIQSHNRNSFEITMQKELFHNYYSPQTSIVRRKSVAGIFFPENQKYSEDMRFFLEILSNNKCVYIPILVAKNFYDKEIFGDSGLSSRLWEMEKGELQNLAFIYSIKKVSFLIFCLAYAWSFIKFLRRVFISELRKIRTWRR